MTAQIPEKLFVRGVALELYDTPLIRYLKRLSRARRPRFAPESTALWRGYVGTWAIRDGWLWLDALEGWMWQGETIVEATLETAFPWVSGPLKATFLTGDLRCPEGARLIYRHAGFANTFERDRTFHIQRGKVIDEMLTLNPPDPIEYWIMPDGSRRRAITDPDSTEPPPDLYGPEETPRGARYWRQAADDLEATLAEDDPPHVMGLTTLGAQA
mgnify:CR=1 FL=1